MRFLNSFSISLKLPIIMVFLVSLAAGMSGLISYRAEKQDLLKEAQAILSSVLDARATKLESTFAQNIAEMEVMASRNSTARAVFSFGRGWRAFGASPGDLLQQLYITDNPHPAGERAALDWAGDDSTYSTIHAQLHPEFRAVQKTYGYDDIFLFDTEGNLVYSVAKNVDFATNFLTGPYRDTGLARAWQDANTAAQGEWVFMDFAEYAPAGAVPAGFLAMPLFDRQGKRAGVMAYQLSSALISGVTRLASGLGRTGEVYVAAADGLLRSDPRFAGESGDEPHASRAIVETEAARRALAGESGVLEGSGRNGAPAISAYRPIDVFGMRWAMVAEQTRDEVFAGANALLRKLIMESMLIILGVSVVAIAFSRSLSRPLNALTEAMAAVSHKNFDVEIPATGRGDEIGGMANTLADFRDQLIEAEQVQLESHFRGAAFAGSSAAIMMVNQNLEIMHVNPTVLKLLEKYEADFCAVVPGFDSSQVVGRCIDEFHPSGLRERVRAILSDPANLPYKANLALGDVRLSLDINAVSGEDGAQLGYVVEWIDVTSEYLNQAILHAIDTNQVKAEFRMSGELLSANAHFCQMMGCDEASLIDRRVEALFAFDSQLAAERGAVFDRLRQGESVYGRFELPRPDGRMATVDGGFSPVVDVNGKALRIVLLANDVTAARQEIQAAEAQRAAMEAQQSQVVEALRVGLGQLSEGDLTARIDAAFGADYEQLRLDFNTAVDKLLAAMRGVVENADLINGEASEISNAADDLSQRTEKQAATLEQTAAALDQLTSSVRSAADGASHANEVVEGARKNAEASGAVVREAVEAMGEIESSSRQISKITGVIDDIAFQTNLLALNAGVEAARAGEAGRGFAVVASEVRALAQRSSDAAREINELISASGSQVRRGVDLVDQAGTALAGIVESVTEISRNVSTIAASSREQSAGLAEINAAVNQLDQVTQQNAAMFEETTAASHALTREAETLTRTMERFRTTDTPPTAEVVSPAAFTSRRDPELAVRSATTPGQAPAVQPAPTATAAATARTLPTPQDQNSPDADDGWDDF